MIQEAVQVPETGGHEVFMREAIRLSRENMLQGQGGPFGAVIVRGNEIIGRGWNQVLVNKDPTAHAEVQAIRDACKNVGDFNLNGCILYTSCEPCPMCLAASYWARVDKMYFANTRKDAASIKFDDDFIYQEIPKELKDRSLPAEQILQPEAFTVFEMWANKDDRTHY